MHPVNMPTPTTAELHEAARILRAHGLEGCADEMQRQADYRDEDVRLCVRFFDEVYAQNYRPEHHAMHRAEWARVPETKPEMMAEIRRHLDVSAPHRHGAA
jgi:hypothetical protein